MSCYVIPSVRHLQVAFLQKFNQIEEKAKLYYSSESTQKRSAEIPGLRNVVSRQIDATVKELEVEHFF